MLGLKSKQQKQTEAQLRGIAARIEEFEAQAGAEIADLLAQQGKVRNEIRKLEQGPPPSDPVARARYHATKEQFHAALWVEYRRLDALIKDKKQTLELQRKTLGNQRNRLELELAS